MRITPKESERDRLLREGRLEARKEIERRFHSRTPIWKQKHQLGPGNGVSVPDQDPPQ